MKTNLLFSSFPFITGDKVTLNRMSELDLNALWEIVGDEELYRFAPTAALRSSSECTGKLRQAETLFRDRRAVVLGVYPKGENRLTGVFEIREPDPEVESVSVSVTVSQKDWGKGYASSALRAASAYLLNTIGVRRIQAAILPNNFRAATLLERCGFQKEGTLREAFRWPDKGIVDLSIYSLLPSDMRPKSSGPNYYL